jgi:hypothetical protein
MTWKHLLLLSAAALTMPGEAAAQRWFVGAGGAYAAVHEGETDVSATRPGVHLAVGRSVWRGATTEITAGVEGTAYGLFDEEPRVTDFIPGTSTFQRIPEVAGTQVLLAFVQFKAAGFYVRPGIGLGRHSFASYLFGPGDQVQDAYVGHEAGPAAGLAAGYAVTRGGGVSVGLVGVAVVSHGEASAASRGVYGLRIVPTFRL